MHLIIIIIIWDLKKKDGLTGVSRSQTTKKKP